MPAKQTQLSDEERARRLKETAEAVGADVEVELFDRALEVCGAVEAGTG